MHTLGSLHARPPTLHASVIPFSDIRQEKGECKSPICNHYTKCALVSNTSGENSKKKKKKEKEKKRCKAHGFETGHLKVLRNILFDIEIIALGDILKKMPQ